MKSGLRVAFLLLLVAGTVTVKGSDLSDALDDIDPSHEAAVHRHKRGFSVFDILRGNGASSVGPKPTKATGGNDFGLDLAHALKPDPQTPKPHGGNGFGFNLADALNPAEKPTGKPSGEDYEKDVIQKLRKVIENQNEQLKMLMKLVARMN